MKVLVFVKATPKSEKGLVVDEQTKQMFADMGQFNEQLVKAGLIQDADGLKPSSFGKRVHFSGQHVSVVDGPFAETKELVAGYWIWNVKSMGEALEWAKRCPNPMPGEEGILEIRPTFEMEDFKGLVSDEQAAQEVAQRSAPKPKAAAKKAPETRAKARPKSKAKAKGKPQSNARSRRKK